MPVLSIQSHVSFGQVGNRAAGFVLQRLGHPVWAVDTVHFSNHTGYGAWTGEVVTPGAVGALLDGVLARAQETGEIGDCRAVLSGYLGSAALGEVVLGAAARVRAATPDALWCCDPVMGDVEKGLFVAPDIPAFMRERLTPAADILTPNLFELGLLAEREIATRAEALAAARVVLARGPRLVLVTSLLLPETPDGKIEMLAVSAEEAWAVATPRMTLEPPRGGLGDATAALFLAHFLETGHARAALERTAAGMHELVQATARKPGRELALVEAQDRLVAPGKSFAAEAI
jgi:pyridoxine kinase